MGQKHHNSATVRITLAAYAVTLTLLVVPALAQHATGHAPMGHSGVGHAIGPPAPMGFGHPIGTPVHSVPGIASNPLGHGSATQHSWQMRPDLHARPNHLRSHRVYRYNRARFGVGYVGIPYYVDPLPFADDGFDSDDSDNTAEQTQPEPAPEDYGQQPPYAEGPEGPGTYDQGYGPEPRPPYNPQFGAPAPQNTAATQSDGLDHPEVTLVFNDGRPSEKIHSYVLTGSSIFVAEPGHQYSIPIADLDLPATIAQNREAGVDFQLPNGGK